MILILARGNPYKFQPLSYLFQANLNPTGNFQDDYTMSFRPFKNKKNNFNMTYGSMYYGG